MKRQVADEASLRTQLLGFEERFGLSSVAFYRLHKSQDDPPHVPPFERLVWADTCLRWHRVATRDRSTQAPKAPAPAN
jgi:hypothetical protein